MCSISNAEEVEIAKQLANPVAALVSVPFQFNYDRGYGSADGYKAYVNIQPVIPFSISDSWNVISRTIVPVVSQHNVAGKSGTQSGLGDITQSFFFFSKAPHVGRPYLGSRARFLGAYRHGLAVRGKKMGRRALGGLVEAKGQFDLWGVGQPHLVAGRAE